MGNLKAILPIALSLLIAVGCSFYLYQWIQAKTGPEKTVIMESVEGMPVVVAKMDLSWGTRLTADMLQVTPFLKESLPQGYFDAPGEVIERVVTTPLKRGDPVVEHRLAARDIKVGGVSAVLKVGSRAIAVRGNKVIGISGFINPGNRVDVLVTIKDPQSDQQVSKTVLENILILASGTEIEENKKTGPSPVDVYTLEVTPDEAERLVLSATRGKLQFSLRNVTDVDKVKTQGITIAQLLGSPARAEESPAPVRPKPVRVVYKKPVRRNAFVGENIRGLEVSTEKFIIKKNK